jgi:hypothetical protein
MATNPKINDGGDYAGNCGYCTTVYELRRRGFDVEANPSVPMFLDEWKGMFENFNPIKVTSDSKDGAVEELTREIKLWGEGARGTVFMEVDGGEIGHFFSVEVAGGDVLFVDPQNGEINVVSYFEVAKRSSVVYGRLDNLNMSENVKKACRGRR